MSIRPVEIQTMLPKITELQKSKSVESEIQKNNLNINILKDQQQHENSTKTVVETKKSEGQKITRDGRQKGKEGRQDKENNKENDENHSEHGKESLNKKASKIDIRI